MQGFLCRTAWAFKAIHRGASRTHREEGRPAREEKQRLPPQHPSQGRTQECPLQSPLEAALPSKDRWVPWGTERPLTSGELGAEGQEPKTGLLQQLSQTDWGRQGWGSCRAVAGEAQQRDRPGVERRELARRKTLRCVEGFAYIPNILFFLGRTFWDFCLFLLCFVQCWGSNPGPPHTLGKGSPPEPQLQLPRGES